MAKQGGKPVGRPSKYREIFFFHNDAYKNEADRWIKNNAAWERLGKLVQIGLTNEQLAVVYEVEEQRIYKWIDKNVEFGEELEKNKRRYDDGRVVRSLYEKANGFKGKETKAFVIAGKIETVEVEKHFAPDTAAIQTWLYNRQPEQWRSINHIDYNMKSPPPPIQYDFTKLSDEEVEMFEYMLKKMST